MDTTNVPGAPSPPLSTPCKSCGSPSAAGANYCQKCTQRKHSTRRLFLIWTIVAIAGNAALVFWHRAAIDPSRAWLDPVTPGAMLLLMGTMFSIPATALGLFLCIFRGGRTFGARLAGCAAIQLLVGAMAMNFLQQGESRDKKIDEIIARAAPLVTAIKKYEAVHGQPPARLDDLVPALLPAIPTPGLNESTPFEYLVGEPAKFHRDNPWVLTVSISKSGFIAKADLLMYYPKLNYPDHGSRGPIIRRIKDWALDVD